MAETSSKRTAKKAPAKKAAREEGGGQEGTGQEGAGREGTSDAPRLLSGGNPQIPKGDGDAPVQAYIAAMPGWKSDLGRRIDELIVQTVPDVHKALKWNSPFFGVEDRSWFLSIHCLTKYVQVTWFRGTSLDPVPEGTSKTPENVRPEHLRGRVRRGAVRVVGDAGQPAAGGAHLRLRRRRGLSAVRPHALRLVVRGVPGDQRRPPVGDLLLLVVLVEVPRRLGEGAVGPAAEHDAVLLLGHGGHDRAGLVGSGSPDIRPPTAIITSMTRSGSSSTTASQYTCR